MSQKTISEDLFEKFCDQNGIKWERIKPASEEGEKASDYFIYPQDQKIVVEVKQIDPNADDLEWESKSQQGEIFVRSTTPGKRVGQKIRDAYPQLKSNSEEKYSCLLILYNNVPSSSPDYLEPYHIKVGMYGLEQFVYAVPRNTIESPYVTDKIFGPKRQVTPDHKTALSSVGVIYNLPGKDLNLDIYHNIHANMKLMPEWLHGSNFNHWTLEERRPGEFQNWVKV